MFGTSRKEINLATVFTFITVKSVSMIVNMTVMTPLIYMVNICNYLYLNSPPPTDLSLFAVINY